MPFIRFNKGSARVGRILNEPTLTITKSGMMGLNTSAARQYNLEEYKYVTLYYDADAKLIGLQPTNKEDVSNYKLRGRVGGGMEVFGKLFFRQFDIDYSRLRHCNLTYDEHEGMMIADNGKEN